MTQVSDLTDWLFRPGDIVYMWPDEHGRGFRGYVQIHGCRLEGSAFPIYDVSIAYYERFIGDEYYWRSNHLIHGAPRDHVEQRCSYVCQGWNRYYKSPVPISPISRDTRESRLCSSSLGASR